MTRADFRAKWDYEVAVFRRRRAFVDAAALCEEILADFEAVTVFEMDAVLNLTQAAAESGYSPDHLGHLVRTGAIPNAGHPHAPKIRRKDLPLKPSRVRHRVLADSLAEGMRVGIARSIVGRSKQVCEFVP